MVPETGDVNGDCELPREAEDAVESSGDLVAGIGGMTTGIGGGIFDIAGYEGGGDVYGMWPIGTQSMLVGGDLYEVKMFVYGNVCS